MLSLFSWQPAISYSGPALVYIRGKKRVCVFSVSKERAIKTKKGLFWDEKDKKKKNIKKSLKRKKRQFLRQKRSKKDQKKFKKKKKTIFETKKNEIRIKKMTKIDYKKHGYNLQNGGEQGGCWDKKHDEKGIEKKDDFET